MLYLVLSLTALLCVSPTDGQCYDGWVYHGSSCYGFGEDYVTWAGASALCAIFDGALAEIETAEENDFLKAYARNHSYPNLWVGGTDVFSESYWMWSNSKRPVSGFTNWGYGEPNHAGGSSNEDCMELYGHKGYTWNDEDCRQNNRFVCEISMEE